MKTYKGFDKDFKCRGFQYQAGRTYTHDGDVKACESGFHACEYPLDVFSYYPPATSMFCEVEQAGDIATHGADSKIASKEITIKAEIDLPGLIKAAIEYTFSKTTESKTASNSGDYGAASNSGDYGAASNSGIRGAASNSGIRGAASNSGYRGAASNSGYQGAASNSGAQGAASNSGDYGVAAAFGLASKAKSDTTGAIVCVYRNDSGELTHIRASKVGENGIKANIWYTLDENGNFIEVAE